MRALGPPPDRLVQSLIILYFLVERAVVTFVYVDSDGRLIRMEEPALDEMIVVELKKIHQDRPRWGKEKDENE